MHKEFRGGGSKGVLGVGSKVQFWGPISLCLCAFLGLETGYTADFGFPAGRPKMFGNFPEVPVMKIRVSAPAPYTIPTVSKQKIRCPFIGSEQKGPAEQVAPRFPECLPSKLADFECAFSL